MVLSVAGFLGLLIAVALLRGVELLISRRNQHRLEALGVCRTREPHFHWMVLLHAAVLVGAALEVLWLQRPLIPVLAILMGTLFVLANVLRWWVIRTLGNHWNVQIMDSVSLGVITSGPFRFVRHPNYAAVFVELVALPLIHTAWLTALVGVAGHVWVLSGRVAVEEAVLLRNGDYRATVARRPRFVPRLFDKRATLPQSQQRDLAVNKAHSGARRELSLSTKGCAVMSPSASTLRTTARSDSRRSDTKTTAREAGHQRRRGKNPSRRAAPREKPCTS